MRCGFAFAGSVLSVDRVSRAQRCTVPARAGRSHTQNVGRPANRPRITDNTLSIFFASFLCIPSRTLIAQARTRGRLVRSGRPAKVRRWIIHLRNNLGAAQTSWASFLCKPAASRPYSAERENFDYRGQNLYDPCCQTAIASIEMLAPSFLARRCEPENFGRFDRTGLREQLVGDRNRLVHISNLWTRV
jgi:hypothetical protein